MIGPTDLLHSSPAPHSKEIWTGTNKKKLSGVFIIIIIIIYFSRSWATCWPVPVSHIQKSLQRSTMIPSANYYARVKEIPRRRTHGLPLVTFNSAQTTPVWEDQVTILNTKKEGTPLPTTRKRGHSTARNTRRHVHSDWNIWYFHTRQYQAQGTTDHKTQHSLK